MHIAKFFLTHPIGMELLSIWHLRVEQYMTMCVLVLVSLSGKEFFATDSVEGSSGCIWAPASARAGDLL